MTGQKGESDADSEEIASVDEAVPEDSAEVVVPPVVELPSIGEIEAILFAREEFQVAVSWLERLAQERANRVKDYLATAHEIDASRIFLAGEAAVDASLRSSLVQFDLTD